MRYLLSVLALFVSISTVSSKALINPYIYDVRSDGALIRAVGSGPNDRLAVTLEGKTEQTCTAPVPMTNGKFMYSIEISGLKALTQYRYKCYFGKKEFEAVTFRTAPETGSSGGFKFGVWGDTQTYILNVKFSSAISALSPDLLLHVGDLVRGDGRIWREWVDYYFGGHEALLRNTPAFPVPGNHEKGVLTFSELFPTPKTCGSKHAGNGYFTFDYGNAHFITAHLWDLSMTEDDKAGLYNANLNGRDDVAELIEMFKEDMARESTKAQKWKIFYMHMPPDHPKAAKGVKDAWQKILPYLKEYGVDISFFGHKHNFVDTREVVVDGVRSGIFGMTVGLYWSAPEDWVIENVPSTKNTPSFALVEVNANGGEMRIQPYIWDKSKLEFFPSIKETVIRK